VQLQAGRAPFVMVGFNRRFAPFTRKIRQFFGGRHEPMMIHVRVNAGFIPHDHWIHPGRPHRGRVLSFRGLGALRDRFSYS